MENQPTQPTEQKQWMNTKQCAEYINVSVASIERFKREFGLPHSKVAQTTRYNRNSIDEWLLKSERINPIVRGV